MERNKMEVTTGVCNLQDVDIDALMGLVETDFHLIEHMEQCEKCQKDEECPDIEFWESTTVWYSDVEVKKNEKTGQWEFPNATIIIKENRDIATLQIVLSPVVENHGKCSPCYPMQADLDSSGSIPCYALPEDYKSIY